MGASPAPDHQVSRFAPERIYVVRHPCAVPDPLRLVAQGARPDAGRWTGQVHRPQRRVTTLVGMPYDHSRFLPQALPAPGRPRRIIRGARPALGH